MNYFVVLLRFAAVVFLAVSLYSSCQVAKPNSAIRPISMEEWREDLHFLVAQMRQKHKSLFHSVTEADFNSAVEKLDLDLPNLNEDQVLVRLLQIMALVQDGHTGFDTHPFPPTDEPKDRIPVRFVQYADGVYVRAAAPKYASAVGGKVERIGDHTCLEALKLVNSTVPHDAGNDGEEVAWSAKTNLNWPRLLHGLGLSSSSDGADFVIVKNGESRTFHMKSSISLGKWYSNGIPPGWVEARSKSVPVPVSQQHESSPYWFASIPESHAIYFQFNLVVNDQESLADFSKRLASALSEPGVDRLVIDLRNNTGGDNTLLRPLLLTLIRSPQNRRGGIFAITGPTTFSAAQNFVNRLESYTDVIFVGEPTGQNVNFFADTTGFMLSHSHLTAAVSHLWWQDKDPRDTRTATFPEAAVRSTFHEYLTGADAPLQYALTGSVPESLEEALERTVSRGIDPELASYLSFVNDPMHEYLRDPESKVNALGYKLMSEKRLSDAITIFQVNARTHRPTFPLCICNSLTTCRTQLPFGSGCFRCLGRLYCFCATEQRPGTLQAGNLGIYGGKNVVDRHGRNYSVNPK
jgi:hypothetical protein